MTQMQLLLAGRSMLEAMLKHGIKPNDVRYIDMVMDADAMAKKGEQKIYIVQHLSDKYGISTRSVYSIIERLHSEVDI